VILVVDALMNGRAKARSAPLNKSRSATAIRNVIPVWQQEIETDGVRAHDEG
jgi:hypothetical protein